MKVIALLSGGKDSLYNLFKCKQDGHELVGVANLKPPDGTEELDSYMYQTVGHQAIELICESLGLPLFRAHITGEPVNCDLTYVEPTTDKDTKDEVEQLHSLLKDIKTKIDFDAVSVGAICSSYQKSRVENICKRLNISMLAYLWRQDQDSLLQQMIDNNFDAILIKVACIGLGRKHVGASLKDMQQELRDLKQKYGTNICGEGGEFETLVLDCPLYSKRLQIDQFELVCHSDDAFAPVFFMKPIKMSLVNKD